MKAPLPTQIVVLSLAGSLIGVAVNALSPQGLSWREPVYPTSAAVEVCVAPEEAAADFPFIGVEELIHGCESCSLGFVDARGAAAYARGHIPGAVHLPPEGKEAARAVELLRGFETVVVYDDDARCALATGVAMRLRAAGLRDIRLLEGSWAAWEAARGPARTGACAECGVGR